MKQREIVVPLLETERLVLRGLTEKDIPFLFEHFSRDEINQHVADENVKSMEEALELYEKFIKPRPHLFRLGMVLKETGELIGTLGFYKLSLENRRAVAGADLMKAHWGKGYMTEAMRALIGYGFGEMNLNRIEASADPDNVRSIRLMERLGFRKEGVLRQLDYYKGRFHDDIVYSILREEWEG